MSPRASFVLLFAGLVVGCAEPPPAMDVPLLEDGVERELAPEETVRFRLLLTAGQFFRVEIEQHGIDVVARLRDPAGKVRLEADRMIYEDGPELVAGVAETAGEHVLQLRAWQGLGPRGRVAVRLVAHREASAADRIWARLYSEFLEVEAVSRDAGPAAAIAGYQRAIEQAREREATELEVEATVRLGEAHVDLGHWPEASDAFERAVAIAPGAGLWRMLALEFLGTARLALAEPVAAVEPLTAALALAEGFDHRYRRAMIHFHLAKAFRQQGAIQPALDHFQRARRLFRPWELEKRARVLHDLGVLYHWNLGRPELAREALAEAREIYRELGDPARDELATTLNQLAAVSETLGEPERSIAAYGEALALRRALGERCAEVNTLARLAVVTWPDPAAEQSARRARQILGEEPCRRDRSAVHLRLGIFEERAGRPGAARAEYRESLELYGAQGDRAGQARALLGSARVCRQLGDCDADPLELTRRALGIFEDTRGSLVREDDRIAYGSHTHELFDLLIDLEWSRGEHRAALASAERARARALRDRLHEVGAGLELTRSKPVPIAELRRRLDRSTVLLEYRLGEARSFLWLLSADAEVSFELPPRGEVEKLAEAARALLASPEPIHGLDGWREEAFRPLAETILPPAMAPLLAGRRLLIVADGALELVPFAALPGQDGRPLVDSHEIVHLPSASAWAELRDRPLRPPPAGYLAVVADPVYGLNDERLGTAATRSPPTGSDIARLRGSRREAEAILATAPAASATLALLGFDATKAAVLGGKLRGYRYLHFATHGEVHPRQPALSSLAFAQLDPQGREIDGHLFAHELYGLDLGAELVVLAGCDTGLGPRIPGEGLVSGLARGFLYAGARRVIVSLWPISDRATPELMIRFYTGLLETGDPARSLHLAQRELYREGRHPFEWAGLVIQGD